MYPENNQEYDGPVASEMMDGTQEVDPARAALVGKVIAEVRADKAHWDKAFKRMKEDMRNAKDGTSIEQFRHGKKYVANVIGQHIGTRVAKLYAKNPKVSFSRRPRRSFKIWDGNQQSIEMIVQKIAQGVPPTAADVAIIEDFKNGMALTKMYEGNGDTLVKLFNYYLTEQKPKFKTQMKQLVRRTTTCGVGFIKLGFQRQLQRRTAAQSQIDDITLQLQNAQRIMENMKDGEVREDCPDCEELRLQLEALQDDPSSMQIVREGLVFDFPKSTAIIPGRDCENLVGFIGASRVAHEIFMSAEEIQEIYNVRLASGSFTAYEQKSANSEDGYKPVRQDGVGANLHRMHGCIWEVYDKKTAMVYTVLEGYRDFLNEPGAPNVEVEGFYPIYTLMFNGIEDEKEIYPKSDVRLLMPMQDEWNRSREGLREHRHAARPRYAIRKGALDENDKQTLSTLGPHQTAELNLTGDQKITDVLAQVPVSGVDNNLYDTSPLMEDMTIVAGAQESSMGATSGATATEVADAASTTMSTIETAIDELNDFLTEIARDGGQVLMLNMSKETVMEIVGEGAVWPEIEENRLNVVKELYLEIKAGSSGRANKAMDLANFERMIPLLTQWPGVNKEAMFREFLKRLDDSLDPVDFMDNTMSVVAMNAMSVPTGQVGPEGPPDQQGAQGGLNAPGSNNEASGSLPPMGPT